MKKTVNKNNANPNKDIVLGLLFIKFSNDAKEDYHIPDIAQWSYLMGCRSDEDIAAKIDAAIAAIEENNTFLTTDFVEDYYVDLNLDIKTIPFLLDVINDVEAFDDEIDEKKVAEIVSTISLLMEDFNTQTIIG
jgi:type I restriction-modification system DNA methylase subunit